MPSFVLRGRAYNNPVELALEALGGKWKMPILWRLKDRTWRYGELRRSLGRVTDKMLAKQLRELASDGLLTRTVREVVPPHVDYDITPLGRTAVPVIDALRAWGAALLQARGGGAVVPRSGGGRRQAARRP